MPSAASPHRITPHIRLGRIEAVINATSGGVGPGAAEQMTSIFAEYGFNVVPRVLMANDVASGVEAAVARSPQILILLAGDGTLALGAKLCRCNGPLLVALPGGTMNMLPYALNGRRGWQDALRAVIETGCELEISGGEVGGKKFYVAAILGAPALWADAREAIRRGKLRLAMLRARRAVLRAFKGRLHFALDGGERHKAEALTLMCPLVSRGLKDDIGLEASTLNPKDALAAFRLGLSTLTGNWRSDPSVRVEVCQRGEAWARGRVPAILDGEPHRLISPISIAYRSKAFRALVPADSEVLRVKREAAIEPFAFRSSDSGGAGTSAAAV